MVILRRVRVLFLAGFMLAIAGCQGQQEIVGALSESDANELMVVLQSQHIDVTKVAIPGRTITYSLSVKSGDATTAMRILVDNKLPKKPSNGLADVYPPGGGGLIPTGSEEKAKFLMAIQGEIENMLKVLPGIVQARVVVVLPDTDAIRDLNSPPPKATSSVAIVYNPIDDKGTPSVTPDDVKYLVASAVEDLSPTGVTVVMASNVPMKLIDISKNQPSKTTTKPQTATAGTTETPSTPEATHSAPPAALTHQAPGYIAAKTAAAQDAEGRNHILIWLFATLALVGLVLGLFGLFRAISLRSKLAQMERSLGRTQPAGEMPTNASVPPKETTSGQEGTSA
jgi:type III secretion protein J